MSITLLADTGMPFNRKERYFTGTVFPMLVCAEEFKHFGRLTELAGLGPITVDASPSSANIQFFTEYGFAESVFGDVKDRFADAPTNRDTPDVMIYVAGSRRVLLAIEAKMYDRPSRAELEVQLGAQAPLLAYLAGRLGIASANIAHVALLPERLAVDVGRLSVPTITWERLLETYADVGSTYFCEVLREALARYDARRSLKIASGANAETKLLGAEIYRRYHDGTLAAWWMGRQSGLHGSPLAKDITTGAWRTNRYECSSKPVGNPNWFTVSAFVAKIDEQNPPKS